MVDDFRRQYPTAGAFESVFPSVVSLDIRAPRTGLGTPIRLGMLSYLMIPKGVDLAIEVFRALHQNGRPARLMLAGAIGSRDARLLIDEAQKSFPDGVRYLGTVYGESKVEFFNNIDVLLFPTRYREESWGIVLNEALAAAVPVITFDRGCTRTVVGQRAGLVVSRDGDYVTLATQQIERWMDAPDEYRASSAAAVAQAEYLNRQGEIQLAQFAQRMFEPLDARS
jgi:glycosyltransferase involved in cell wall biosynthesis